MAIGGPQNGGGDELEGEGGGIFADINITPLTDIFLVLLIIFMVTTTAIAEAGQDRGAFKVNLPKGSKGDTGDVPRDLTVAILADGRAVIGGRVQDEAELARTFEASARLDPETILVVQADEGVAHGRVVAVMETARQAGLSRLAIATRAEQGQGGSSP
jgi:biopolymer transport protein ExbD